MNSRDAGLLYRLAEYIPRYAAVWWETLSTPDAQRTVLESIPSTSPLPKELFQFMLASAGVGGLLSPVIHYWRSLSAFGVISYDILTGVSGMVVWIIVAGIIQGAANLFKRGTSRRVFRYFVQVQAALFVLTQGVALVWGAVSSILPQSTSLIEFRGGFILSPLTLGFVSTPMLLAIYMVKLRRWTALPLGALAILAPLVVGIRIFITSGVYVAYGESPAAPPHLTPTPTGTRIPPTATTPPTLTHTPTSTRVTPSNTPTPTSTRVTPSITPTPTPTRANQDETVAISEVMFNPCQDFNLNLSEDPSEKLDEYVELYNYGDTDVDLHGYSISDGHPQDIVPWSIRYPYDPNIPGRDTHSDWKLPSHTYGLILSPSYVTSHTRPYDWVIPSNTHIYTVAVDRFLCGTTCVGFGDRRDVLVLYRKDANGLNWIVSTYGTPLFKVGDQLKDPTYVPNNDDAYPLPQESCISFQRFKLSGPDNEFNWVPVDHGSPGFYLPATPRATP